MPLIGEEYRHVSDEKATRGVAPLACKGRFLSGSALALPFHGEDIAEQQFAVGFLHFNNNLTVFQFAHGTRQA